MSTGTGGEFLSNLMLVHQRICSASILLQNHPQRYLQTEIFHDNLSDYNHKKFLFMFISKDDSEIELKHCTSSDGQALSWIKNSPPIPVYSIAQQVE